MAAMFEQQNMMSPQMLDMMKNMDFSQDKVNQQFQNLGLKPEDVITKVRARVSMCGCVCVCVCARVRKRGCGSLSSTRLPVHPSLCLSRDPM